MQLHPTQLLVRPLITEKNSLARDADNEYVFEVHSEATKPAIKLAVEELFAVKVEEVRTLITRGKNRRVGRHTGKKANRKKAFVRLATGQTIDFFEGV
jgi:large subunit ribosomal protein L23